MSTLKKGFIPVMLTPFHTDGSIDYKNLTALTEMYLKTGAAGLFANCLSSEMFELTNAERFKMVRHVVEVVNGEVPVVATGTFEGTVQEQAHFTNQIYSTGINAVILITSILAKQEESDIHFNDNVHKLLHLTPGVPTGFYECPVPYKRLLSAPQLKSFVDTGRVIYHKDTCLDIHQIKQKLSVITNPNFGLYDAYMVHAFESLNAGAAGLSCIQGNFFPELIVWICDNYNNESKSDEIKAVKKFIKDHMAVMHNIYPITAKYSLQKRGIPVSTFTRRYVGKFSQEVKNDIDSLHLKYEIIRKNIGF